MKCVGGDLKKTSTLVITVDDFYTALHFLAYVSRLSGFRVESSSETSTHSKRKGGWTSSQLY